MRLGTRGSALALAQADAVAAALQSAGVQTEIVPITTLGDRGAAIADKSRWVSELEHALLEDRIDIAVHSAKDVPTELEPGLELIAVPTRADPRDVICGAAGLHTLPGGSRIGTASLRRTAQIRAAREDLEVVELRGNVDTRLRKLAEGQVDAIVLALAGLERLHRAQDATATIDEFVPAAGQGALALQARPGTLSQDALAAVNDPEAMSCLTAERELVAALGASCHTPVGAHARVMIDGRLQLRCWIGLPDGSRWLRDAVINDGREVGAECAERMLAAGAAELLAVAEAAAVGEA
jgi:hydroxymethylbilane synthase